MFPPACAGCHRPLAGASPLCPRCDAALPRPDGAALLADLDGARAAVLFEGEAARWVHRFKYPGRGLRALDPAAESVLAAWVREAAAGLPGAPDRVIPVPDHARRRRQRGFHPAGLLARAVAEAAGAPLDARGLVRVRATRSQTALDVAARRRNVAGAFACPRPPGARVWLVDDVVTTGATLGEAARTLRDAGAREVWAVCAARTPARRLEGPSPRGPAP